MKKEFVSSIIGIFGGMVSHFFGGWSSGITTLLIMMALDWVTGLMVAGVFKASKKTASGGLNSSIGLKGLCKKVTMLIIIIVAYRFDLILGINYIRDAAVIGLIVNEAISLFENVGLMGISIPKVIYKAIDVLKENSGEEEKENYENK